MDAMDPTVCRQARLSRDSRFDGEFFLAVTSTGIYCRPICPARPPREKNVRYYRTAAEAASEGFRPCLRCRPESAPNSAAWCGTSTTVSRALQLIEAGALNREPLPGLARRLGIGERYLRKLFSEQLGTSPKAVAQVQRLHFAQKLLQETTLPVTEIAYASGFGSVRRFNSATRHSFGCTPGELRRSHTQKRRPGNGIELELSYRPPLDWAFFLAFYEHHAIEGIESVDRGTYRRRIRVGDQFATIAVNRHPQRDALTVRIDVTDTGQLMPIVANIRRIFDLDANPDEIRSVLSQDKLMAELLSEIPGVRSPLSWSPFEACVRAIAGQQVSTAAAQKVCAKLAAACSGEKPVTFPEPEDILALGDNAFPMPGRRRDCLRAAAAFFRDEEPEVDNPATALRQLPGIGPWTQNLVTLRGYGDPDTFPGGDLGLEKALKARGMPKHMRATDYAERWRPWRSYAANLLWRSLP